MTQESLTPALRRVLAGESSRLPLDPWLGWLLICLLRQRARQTWLMQVSRENLAGADRDHGPVPGLPGWTFDYHGMGLCLSGPAAEALDVDFHDEQGATMDPYFFASRARSG